MDKEARYYKDEYENLRRKKKKEIEYLNLRIEKMKVQQSKMCKVTLDLLRSLGIPDKVILDYYRREMSK